MSRTAALLVLACLALAGEDLLPHAPAGLAELHGTLHGQRFWARLTAPKAEFGGNRVLELVYTPPTPAALAGAHLPDTPFLLLDERLRLVAWNGRDSLTKVLADAKGYRITREEEIPTADGTDKTPSGRDGAIAGPRGWDERIAPLLVTLCWRAKSRGEVPTYDLFAVAPARSATTWDDGQVLISGRPHRAVPDTTGRLARLEDAAGTPVLTVAAWIAPLP